MNFQLTINFFLEPETGFLIAFNMFDTDGNQRVDKEEFLVVSYKKEYNFGSFLFHTRPVVAKPPARRLSLFATSTPYI